MIVGKPTNPLPGVFQRLHSIDWVSLEGGVRYKPIQHESYGITLHAWSFSRKEYAVDLAVASDPLGSTAANIRKERGVVMAVNGGFFDIDRNSRLTPSGLVVAQGRIVSNLSETRRGGSGVLFERGGNIGIDFSRIFNTQGLDAGVQVGPLVVDPGGVNGIRRNDFDRQDRSVVCLTGDRFVVVVISGGLSLHEVGELLSTSEAQGGFGCERAINLDGGPSTQVAFKIGQQAIEIDDRWKISNAIVVQRRKDGQLGPIGLSFNHALTIWFFVIAGLLAAALLAIRLRFKKAKRRG
jgi:uncharacterized protein YigE (DUF2233 family)